MRVSIMSTTDKAFESVAKPVAWFNRQLNAFISRSKDAEEMRELSSEPLDRSALPSGALRHRRSLLVNYVVRSH